MRMARTCALLLVSVLFLPGCNSDDPVRGTVVNQAPQIVGLPSVVTVEARGQDFPMSFMLLDSENERMSWTATLAKTPQTTVSPSSDVDISSGAQVRITIHSGLPSIGTLTISAVDQSGKEAIAIVTVEILKS